MIPAGTTTTARKFGMTLLVRSENGSMDFKQPPLGRHTKARRFLAAAGQAEIAKDIKRTITTDGNYDRKTIVRNAMNRHLRCRREVKTVQKEQDILKAIVDARLPYELILMVMEHVVETKCPVVELRRPEDVLLHRRQALGVSKESALLHWFFFEALVKKARLCYIINDSASSLLPSHFVTMPHGLHNVELVCPVEVTCKGVVYPANLIRTRRLIETLPPLLPRLKSLTLYVKFNASCGHTHSDLATWGGIGVLFGDPQHSTLLQVVEDTMRAFVNLSTAETKVFKGLWQQFADREQALPGVESVVDVGDLSPGPDVVEAVFGKGRCADRAGTKAPIKLQRQ